MLGPWWFFTLIWKDREGVAFGSMTFWFLSPTVLQTGAILALWTSMRHDMSILFCPWSIEAMEMRILICSVHNKLGLSCAKLTTNKNRQWQWQRIPLLSLNNSGDVFRCGIFWTLEQSAPPLFILRQWSIYEYMGKSPHGWSLSTQGERVIYRSNISSISQQFLNIGRFR